MRQKLSVEGLSGTRMFLQLPSVIQTINSPLYLASRLNETSMNSHQNSPVVGMATAEELSCIILRGEI